MKVRDRLTHPKGVVDLTVSDTEFGDCLAALVWVESLMLEALIEHTEWEIAKKAETDENLATFLRSLTSGAAIPTPHPSVGAVNSSPES